MRLLVLQLSDIHIKSQTDFVLSRAKRIADAVKDLDHEVTQCLVALTGDIAYAGTAEQFAWAEKWVEQVREAVAAALPRAAVTVVAIPGNHDCDLRAPSPARAALIDAMLKDARVAADVGTVAVCTPPQREFFAFRDKVAADALVGPGELYYEYRITGDTADADVPAETVLVRCMNTAWVSQVPETAARLVYPETAIPDTAGSDVLVITLLHHPYNWLEPMNARAVRRAVQNVSDVILTGHEHAPGLHQQEDEVGATSLYIEGLALQGHGNAGKPESAFHAILIDTLRRERRLVSYRWGEAGRYEEERGAAADWAPFTANPLRAGHVFPLSNAMRQRLGDPGVTLSHPSRGPLSLDDIFVYPDLTEIRYQPKAGQAPVTRGERLLELAIQSGRLLVTGTDDSGKSTLAKRLFVDALDAGMVPVLLDGRAARLRGDDRDKKELALAFEEQYAASGSAYLDTPTAQRIILLDDFAALKVLERTHPEVLDYLTHFAGTVVLFAHDVAQQVREIAGLTPLALGRTPFAHHRILPVSHVRREEFIARYISLASLSSSDETEALRAQMRKVLAAAVGKFHAPPVPISIITILQTLAFKDRLDINQATHGYYYELLIKRALYASTSQQEMDVRMAYLTELAFAIYNAGIVQWSEAWFMEFHQLFVKDRRLKFKFRDAVDALIDASIITPISDHFQFRYRYIFYYFVSRALAERLTTDTGRAEIARLTARLHEQEAANILLFLTHHSKDPAIIDPMLEFADSLFGDVPRADLARATSELPQFDEAVQRAVYEDMAIDDSRQKLLERLDEAEPVDEESADGARAASVPVVHAVPTTTAEREEERAQIVTEMLDFVARIYTSFRAMQILGQLLKNFPGTLGGDQKERITRAVYGVGLRTLAAVHRIIQEHPMEHAQGLVEALREKHPDMSSERLVDAVRRTVYWQLYQTSLGVTNRVAADVGNPMLDLVFEDIEQADDVAAIRLISTAIRLDRAGTFPEDRVRALAERFADNPLALRILIGLVVGHFHLFEVPREVRERVCGLLQIEFRPQLPGSRRRLIAGR